MTTPDTPASAPVQVCPDCGRFPCPGPGCFYGDHCEKTKGPNELVICQIFTITRLRQELATMQASHDALVAAAVSNREAYTLGLGVGYKAGTEPTWIPPENPFTKPEKGGG